MNNIAIILSITLMYSAPLIFTALGGVMSENAGVVNIGLEGMMTFGAFTAATVGYYTLNPWLAFLAGGLAGASLALIHAFTTVSLGADHVISGIGINFLGPGLSVFLSRLFFDGAAMTKPVPGEGLIPRSLENVFNNSFLDTVLNQYDTVYLAFFLVFVIWFILYKTRLGLRIRAVGEHPKAADTLGVNVFLVKYIAVIISGILAGFGGAAMSIAVVANFRVTLISGQGFIALAAVIFGKWKPQGSLLACLLFGASTGLAVNLSSSGINVPDTILDMAPYLITLLVLILFVGEGSGPKANGIPYEKN